MFVLRPEVDWAKLREQYRPKALASKSTYEFAGVCADMLKDAARLARLADGGGGECAGVQPAAVGQCQSAGLQGHSRRPQRSEGGVAWAITTDKIGYIAIYGWNDPKIPAECGEALEKMRDTRGLIVDVRLNGGGGEPLARTIRGPFSGKGVRLCLQPIPQRPQAIRT